MFKKMLFTVATLIATMSFAFADVDVNKADQAALDGIKGVGPTMSKAILAERKKGGDFKDWNDFQARVKGIGDKNSEKLSQAGLTVGGASKPAVKSAATAKTDSTVKTTDKKDGKTIKP
jgi:competence protein ComEA